MAGQTVHHMGVGCILSVFLWLKQRGCVRMCACERVSK